MYWLGGIDWSGQVNGVYIVNLFGQMNFPVQINFNSFEITAIHAQIYLENQWNVSTTLILSR